MNTLSAIVALENDTEGELVFGISSRLIFQYSAYLVLGFALFYFIFAFTAKLVWGKPAKFSLINENRVIESLGSPTADILCFAAFLQWFVTVDLLFCRWVRVDSGLAFVVGCFTCIGVAIPFIVDLLVVAIGGIAGYYSAVACRLFIKSVWFPTAQVTLPL